MQLGDVLAFGPHQGPGRGHSLKHRGRHHGRPRDPPAGPRGDGRPGGTSMHSATTGRTRTPPRRSRLATLPLRLPTKRNGHSTATWHQMRRARRRRVLSRPPHTGRTCSRACSSGLPRHGRTHAARRRRAAMRRCHGKTLAPPKSASVTLGCIVRPPPTREPVTSVHGPNKLGEHARLLAPVSGS